MPSKREGFFFDMEKTIIFKNSDFVTSTQADLDIFSQTLHYGLGAFEGIRCYSTSNGSQLFKVREHFERLKRSCEKIDIPFNWDIKELMNACYKLLELNQLKDAYIRPLVFSGSGMDLRSSRHSDIIIMAWDWDFYRGNSLLKTCISSVVRPHPNSVPIDAKLTGNYISSIMATHEANKKGYDDCIQLDVRGFIAEAPGANIFMEKDGKLYTPKANEYILHGITRSTLMIIAKHLDIEVVEQDLTVEDLKKAKSAFLCSTAAEVVGIGSVDEVTFSANFSETMGGTLQKVYKNLVLDKLSYEVII